MSEAQDPVLAALGAMLRAFVADPARPWGWPVLTIGRDGERQWSYEPGA